MKSEEDYQNAIVLTHKQELAFNSLMRAAKRCEKENVYFYQVLDTLGALNGDNVAIVREGGENNAPNCLQFKHYPSFRLTDGWADDSHYIELKSEEES